MLYDFIQLDRESGEALWQQLYRGLRQAIEDGRLAPGERLASIRQAGGELSLSRTTVETAYGRLCMEGCVRSRPQSGYEILPVLPRPAPELPKQKPAPLYDFGTGSIDPRATDLESWKRLMRAVLTDSGLLAAYGDPQGERCLREQLAGYAFRARGVTARPDCIFIGAGVGPLLQLLCPLFEDRPPVFMESPGFYQAEQIFRDYGFPLYVPETPGTEYEDPGLPEAERAIAVELPSLRPRMGSTAGAARRGLLSRWVCSGRERYVLEDDYNGELRYKTRALPAFQGSCPERTVYLGSFSKLLVPSVRIAYMVLPEELAERARRRLATLNQTAGKIEQLALAEYIRTGLLEKHLRRLRRLNARKSQKLLRALEEAFGDRAGYTLHETHLSVVMTPHVRAEGEQLCALAREAGIACRAAPGSTACRPRITLGFSGIGEDSIGAGVSALKKAWEGLL